jgi:hypothetical protein
MLYLSEEGRKQCEHNPLIGTATATAGATTTVTAAGMTTTTVTAAAGASRSLRSGAPHRAPRDRGAPVGGSHFEGHPAPRAAPPSRWGNPAETRP